MPGGCQPRPLPAGRLDRTVIILEGCPQDVGISLGQRVLTCTLVQKTKDPRIPGLRVVDAVHGSLDEANDILPESSAAAISSKTAGDDPAQSREYAHGTIPCTKTNLETPRPQREVDLGQVSILDDIATRPPDDEAPAYPPHLLAADGHRGQVD